MRREEYNECMSRALKGKEFTPEERKSAFCVAAKLCTGKAASPQEAQQLCAESAAQPKEPKEPRARKKRSGVGGSVACSGVKLVLITTTGCKACSAAKQFLEPQIEKGEVEVKDVQKDNWAADLAAKYNIVSVPQLLVIDSEGKPFSQIQVSDTAQMIDATP